MGTYQTIYYPVPSSYQMPILTQRSGISDYLHVGEQYYHSFLKDAGEKDFPLRKRPPIRYESIDINVLFIFSEENLFFCFHVIF